MSCLGLVKAEQNVELFSICIGHIIFRRDFALSFILWQCTGRQDSAFHWILVLIIPWYLEHHQLCNLPFHNAGPMLCAQTFGTLKIIIFRDKWKITYFRCSKSTIRAVTLYVRRKPSSTTINPSEDVKLGACITVLKIFVSGAMAFIWL